jgi:polyphosphate kinase
MPRNLFRRVETGFPIRNPRIQEHIQEIIDWFWKDNVKSKVMSFDGFYRSQEITGERFNAQEEFVADSQRRRKAKPPVAQRDLGCSG